MMVRIECGWVNPAWVIDVTPTGNAHGFKSKIRYINDAFIETHWTADTVAAALGGTKPKDSAASGRTGRADA